MARLLRSAVAAVHREGACKFEALFCQSFNRIQRGESVAPQNVPLVTILVVPLSGWYSPMSQTSLAVALFGGIY
jgi:hypothetical protein